MTLQFGAPKLWGAFLLGNLCFAFFLSQRIHWAFGLVHFAFSLSVLLTGFGHSQLYPFAYWLAALSLPLFIVNDSENEDGLWVWKCIAIGGILSAAHGLLQFLGFPWPLHYAPDIDPRTPIAMLGQQTKLGAFLAPCVAICLALRGYWLLGAALCALVGALTGSSFTLFAGLIGGMAVFTGAPAMRKRWILSALAAGVTLIVVAPHFAHTGSMLDDHGRHFVYQDIIKAWWQRPLFGYGPGSFQELFHRYFQSWNTKSVGGGDFLQAHNDYLQVLFEFGLLGFLPLLVALGAIGNAYWSRWSQARAPFVRWESTNILCAQGALAALLVNSLGNFPFVLSPHFLVGVLAAGILLHSVRR